MQSHELAIIGAFISILLIVNGYFFKELLSSTNEVKLKLSILITKHDNTEEISKENRSEIVKIRERVQKLEDIRA